MNTTFGTYLRTTVWGQSHAAAIGCTVEGLPAGEAVDEEALCAFMGRRAPGGRLSTQRRETDQPEILCGLMNGITCGAPLTALIRNTDQRSKDYKAIADRPRPSHADLPAQVRYQGFQDVRGGGALRLPSAARAALPCRFLPAAAFGLQLTWPPSAPLKTGLSAPWAKPMRYCRRG